MQAMVTDPPGAAKAWGPDAAGCVVGGTEVAEGTVVGAEVEVDPAPGAVVEELTDGTVVEEPALGCVVEDAAAAAPAGDVEVGADEVDEPAGTVEAVVSTAPVSSGPARTVSCGRSVTPRPTSPTAATATAVATAVAASQPAPMTRNRRIPAVCLRQG